MADSNTTQEWVAYHYNPSLAAAAIFCGLFALSSALHFYQLIRTRAFYMIPLLIGALMDAIGFGVRIASSIESPDWTLAPYIVQAVLTLVAPAFLAASVYMILGYIIQAVDGEHHSMIRKKWLTKLFVIGDMLSFLIQSNGAGLVTKDDAGARAAGKWIIVGGLAVQLFFFGFFIVVSTKFYIRLAREPTERSKSPSAIPWRLHMWILFTASVLIMIRSVFRVIEYVQGTNGYLLSHEIYLYIFDATLMCGAVLVFNVVHPSQISSLLNGREAVIWVVKMEKKEQLEGAREKDEEEGKNEPRQRWLKARRPQEEQQPLPQMNMAEHMHTAGSRSG